MTSTRDKLIMMYACDPMLRWIGNRSIEQAWRECKRSEWMCWLLEMIVAPGDPRLRLAAADMAERAWRLIPDEPTRLAAAWAIGAARRGDADEMDAASSAASSAARAASSAAVFAAVCAAVCAASNATAFAAAAADTAAADAERSAQADIIRRHFSAREIGRLFRMAPA